MESRARMLRPPPMPIKVCPASPLAGAPLGRLSLFPATPYCTETPLGGAVPAGACHQGSAAAPAVCEDPPSPHAYLAGNPRAVHGIHPEHTEGRFLAHALRAWLPSLECCPPLHLFTPEHVSLLRALLLSCQGYIDLTRRGDPTDAEEFTSLQRPLRRHIPKLIQQGVGLGSGTEFAQECSAAGKPGNEDRVLVVPHFLKYYGVAPTASPAGEKSLIACVCDGHGGCDTAAVACDMFPLLFAEECSAAGGPSSGAMRQAVARMQALLERRYVDTYSQSGTTLTAVALIGSTLYVANLGDSHAYVVSKGGQASCLTEHHHIDDEEERRAALERGVDVQEVRGVLRVAGICRVTRNLGLLQAGASVSHEPHVREWEVTQDDALLIIATDGLWDVCSPETAASLVLQAASQASSQPASQPRNSMTTPSVAASSMMSSLWDCSMVDSLLPCSFATSTLSASPLSTVSGLSLISPISSYLQPKKRAPLAGCLLERAVANNTRDNVGIVVVSLKN